MAINFNDTYEPSALMLPNNGGGSFLQVADEPVREYLNTKQSSLDSLPDNFNFAGSATQGGPAISSLSLRSQSGANAKYISNTTQSNPSFVVVRNSDQNLGVSSATQLASWMNVWQLGDFIPIENRYLSTHDDDESKFEAWLDEKLASMTSENQVLPIVWQVYPGIRGYRSFGILYGFNSNNASLLSITYGLSYSVNIKVKTEGTWTTTYNQNEVVDNYGTSLPPAGRPGRLFYLKA